MAASDFGSMPPAGMVGSSAATRGGPGVSPLGEALAEGVQPDDLAPDRHGLVEQRRRGRDGDAQARLASGDARKRST